MALSGWLFTMTMLAPRPLHIETLWDDLLVAATVIALTQVTRGAVKRRPIPPCVDRVLDASHGCSTRARSARAIGWVVICTGRWQRASAYEELTRSRAHASTANRARLPI